MKFDFFNYLIYAFDGELPLYLTLCLSFCVRCAMSLCAMRSRRFSDKRKSLGLICLFIAAGAAINLFLFYILGWWIEHITLRFYITLLTSFALQGIMLHAVTGRDYALTGFNVQIQITVCLLVDVITVFIVKFAFSGNLIALFVIKYVVLSAVAVFEYFWLRPFFGKLNDLSRSNRFLMLSFPAVSILAMLLVAVCPVPYTVGMLDSELIDFYAVETLVTFLFFSAAIFASYFNFLRAVSSLVGEREEQKELVLERERIKYFEQQSDMAKSNMELVKKQIHDLRHHNMVILGYLQNNDIVGVRKYLSSYDKKLESDIMTNYCVNAAVNNVLIGTTKAARDEGVETIVETAVPAKCKVDDSELVVIFANIYENALEACRKLPKGRKKWIKISCKHTDGKLLIQTENSCSGKVVFVDDELPKSSKSSGGGQGTRSVARVIGKYGGICSFSEKDGIFTFRAILPV